MNGRNAAMKHRGPAEELEISENAEQDRNFYNQSGGLKLHSIKKASDTEIEVLAQTRKGERWVSFSMVVEAQAPHGIADIRVQPGVEPGK